MLPSGGGVTAFHMALHSAGVVSVAHASHVTGSRGWP